MTEERKSSSLVVVRCNRFPAPLASVIPCRPSASNKRAFRFFLFA